MDNKREIFAWSMYDWANSAFSTTVVTTFLGPYLASLAEEQGGSVKFLGLQIEGEAFFPDSASRPQVFQSDVHDAQTVDPPTFAAFDV